MSDFQPKILIVEDESDISSILQAYLGRRGFQVSTTSSGREALVFIEVSKPDVVILDFALDDLNGREALRLLREAGNRTPVVVITGQMLSDDEIDQVRELGVSEYFHKPIVLEKLGQIVARLTGRSLGDQSVCSDSKARVIQPDGSSARRDIHRLVNLLGIIRNKCENFTLNMDDGVYRDHSQEDLIKISVDVLRDIPRVIDNALDVVDRMGPQE